MSGGGAGVAGERAAVRCGGVGQRRNRAWQRHSGTSGKTWEGVERWGGEVGRRVRQERALQIYDTSQVGGRDFKGHRRAW